MSHPNLQQIPVRTTRGREIRAAFLPEDGEGWWSSDFSQQEPRLLVHYASLTKRNDKHLPGVLDAVRRYQENPDMNYHAFAGELTGLAPHPAKVLNLAIIYGRGAANTAAELKCSLDEVKVLFNKHHEGMPFARVMSEIAKEQAERNGFIRSLLGRKCRFPHYEPADFNLRDQTHCFLWEAKKKWPGKRLVRSRIHKALNSLIQPAAATQTKMAMLKIWRAGLGRHILFPVHDELDYSTRDPCVAKQITEIMESAVDLNVPVRVKTTWGPNWGGCARAPSEYDTADGRIEEVSGTTPGRSRRAITTSIADRPENRRGKTT